MIKNVSLKTLSNSYSVSIQSLKSTVRLPAESEIRTPIRENELSVPNKTFDNLWDFILEHQSTNNQSEKAFDLYTRGGKRVIRVKNYVGVIYRAFRGQYG